MTPILLLLAGAAGIFGLSLWPRTHPYTRYIALAVTGFVAMLALASRHAEPTAVVFSLWQPSVLFGTTLAFQIDGVAYPLGLALALVTCSAIIVELSGSALPRPRLTAMLMALLAAGFAALWSANVLTLLVSWVVYDLLWVCGYAAAEGSSQSAMRGLVLSNLATLLLWGGAMLSQGKADNELWSLMTLDNPQWVLWGLAGILRLAIYPVHLSAPGDPGLKSPLAAPLLLSPILGWGLWLRLASISGGPIAAEWMMWLAAITPGVGGLAAWACKSPSQVLMWAGIGVQGAILLAAGLGHGNGVAVIVAGAITWALGVAALFLGWASPRGLRWSRILSAVGGLALLGLPLTSGFLVQSTLLSELTQGDHPEWGGAALWSMAIGNLFLLPALVRYWRASFTPPAAPPPELASAPAIDESPARLLRLLLFHAVRLWQAYGREIGAAVGIGILGLLLVRVGLSPAYFAEDLSQAQDIYSLNYLFTSPGWAGWSLWAATMVFGGLLAGWERVLRPRIEPLAGAIYDILRLEWLYEILAGALNRGLSLFRVADEVVSGAGAMLWAWIIFLLFLLVRGAL